ncbi:metallophosphoesterase family protein [Williamsia sterculiae]|uniref:Predicted phosphoesterase n=1 Tax=Williamsia sterculiae TaxID=1344003 RepID=A0A1N7E135_9NOCA|nr:metallophosphoesterase [Williamsia sterculiae]SIR81773.1 Predicted phosphoesterase [Williamsia sterculiae]
MVRVLSVSDEVVDSLMLGSAQAMAPDLVLAAGDLPFDYLELLMIKCDVPLVFVPGNHDPDLSGYRRGRTGWTRAGLPSVDPGPAGAVNADGRIVTVGGLRIAGLGGCIRYNTGPNQYREGAQRRRSRGLRWRQRVDRIRWSPGPVDVLLTHSPPRGHGDGDDGPHRGFVCFLPLIRALRPQLLLHGHIHPYGSRPTEADIPLPGRDGSGRTVTHRVNTVGYCLFDIEPGGRDITIERRRHGA